MCFILVLLLLAACGSSSDLIETETVDCSAMGNEVSVMLSHAQVETASVRSIVITEPQVTIDVEVSNNTHSDIVVKSIVLHPRDDPRGAFRLNNAYGKFDETIAEGKDHVFTLRTTGRWRRPLIDVEDVRSDSVEVETRVTLGNGQIYRCLFALPVG